jgi:uncharacterized protein (TIGR03435 family)
MQVVTSIMSHINRTPIVGGPAWVRSDLYAIKAKPETPQTTAMMSGPMMLLEEPFGLKVYREQKRGSA